MGFPLVNQFAAFYVEFDNSLHLQGGKPLAAVKQDVDLIGSPLDVEENVVRCSRLPGVQPPKRRKYNILHARYKIPLGVFDVQSREHPVMNAKFFVQIQGCAQVGEFLNGSLLQNHQKVRMQQFPQTVITHIFVGGLEVVHQRVGSFRK